MARLLFKTAVLVSTTLWLAAVALVVWVSSAGEDNPRLSITSSFHVSVVRRERGCLLGYLALFNDPDGPYQGSIIALADEKGNTYPPIEREGFGETCGVYYRHFRWLKTGDTLWTLMLSMVYPLIIVVATPGVWLWWRWQWRASWLRAATGKHKSDSPSAW